VHFWSRGYFHWLLDCLIRLESIETYRLATGHNPTLLIDSSPAAWQIESLHLLGYEPHSWVQWNGKRAHARHLVLPSFRRESGFTPPSGCRRLRDRILLNMPASAYQAEHSSRIVISRRKASSRHIVNEEALIDTLTPLGFQAYVLEDMSFIEQVALFARAEVIISPHGAGLTNMIWAQTSPLIIELFGSYINWCFHRIAAALEFRYGFVECTPHGRDMIVDTSQVTALLHELV
jgi:capsular polysaccharide biosynthesis protein